MAVKKMANYRSPTEHKRGIGKLSQVYDTGLESRMRLRSIVDNAPNTAFQGLNKNGEVIFWNSASEKLYGHKEAQVKGKKLVELNISEPDKPKFRKLVRSVFERKKPSSLREWTKTTKKGEPRFILSSLYPITLSGQDPIAVCMDVDITKRKKAEQRIREMNKQNEKFSEITADILSIENEKELFEHISQAVIDISDFNRVLISYFKEDPPYREIIGYKGVSKTELRRLKKIRMPREKYLRYFEKGTKIGGQSCYIPHTKKHILDQKAVVYGKRKYPRAKGHWHREDNLLVLMKGEKDKIIGIISVDESKSGLTPTDETVRPLETFANLISGHIQRRILARKIKTSEAKYQELVSNVQIGIFRATPEGELLEVNPAGVEMFGYKDSTEFLSRNAIDLYSNPEAREKNLKQLEENGTIKNKEIELRKHDETTFWAAMTSSAIRDGTGKIMYYDTVVEDITERKKSEEKIKELSITDELTKLYNRRHFNEELPKAIKDAETWKSYLSFIMIDIDDFKQYNDRYYHLKGDEILKEIAWVISQNTRERDWASRFGGEEFAIILPGTSSAAAANVAERIRKSFKKVEFRPEDEAVHKTLSAGVAQVHFPERKIPRPSKDKKFTVNYEKIATELADLADKALFKAKKLGKDQVAVSDKTLEPKYTPS
jgi:diguanylate cyclase (GGDEF)-like protein/PAS domain S-box-containing protein